MAPPRLDLDALTLEDVRRGALRGRNVTVLGFARSGIALARFFVDYQCQQSSAADTSGLA